MYTRAYSAPLGMLKVLLPSSVTPSLGCPVQTRAEARSSSAEQQPQARNNTCSNFWSRIKQCPPNVHSDLLTLTVPSRWWTGGTCMTSAQPTSPGQKLEKCGEGVVRCYCKLHPLTSKINYSGWNNSTTAWREAWVEPVYKSIPGCSVCGTWHFIWLLEQVFRITSSRRMASI